MAKQLYRLKAGSHSVGEGLKSHVYNANDPKNNIIESEDNLAKFDPLKFERYEGEAPQRSTGPGEPGEPPPPPPPTDADRAEALAMSQARTPLQKMELAERLRQQADALEDEASNEEKAAQKSRKAARASQTADEDEGDDEDDTEDDLKGLTVADLREKAKEEEIDLPADAKKADILRTIREAREAK